MNNQKASWSANCRSLAALGIAAVGGPRPLMFYVAWHPGNYEPGRFTTENSARFNWPQQWSHQAPQSLCDSRCRQVHKQFTNT